jgi:hypothetical protein
VQDIAVENLDVLNLKRGTAINDDTASVVFLTSRFGVEVGAVEDKSKALLGGNASCRRVENVRVVDGFDAGREVTET